MKEFSRNNRTLLSSAPAVSESSQTIKHPQNALFIVPLCFTAQNISHTSAYSYFLPYPKAPFIPHTLEANSAAAARLSLIAVSPVIPFFR